MNKSNIYRRLLIFSFLNFLTHLTAHYLLVNAVIGTTLYAYGTLLVILLYFLYLILFLRGIKSQEKLPFKHKILPIFLFVLFNYITIVILNLVNLFDRYTTADDITTGINKSTFLSFCFILPLSIIIGFFVKQKKVAERKLEIL
jgi:hypothetical protein